MFQYLHYSEALKKLNNKNFFKFKKFNINIKISNSLIENKLSINTNCPTLYFEAW
jgi:hypothetical protein